jgi:hypothetical protein
MRVSVAFLLRMESEALEPGTDKGEEDGRPGVLRVVSTPLTLSDFGVFGVSTRTGSSLRCALSNGGSGRLEGIVLFR